MSTRPKKLIVPAEGLSVPKPGGGTLARSGELLPMLPYWTRRARDGDVTIEDRPARPAPPKPKSKAEA